MKQKSKDLDQSYCKENERYCFDEKNSEDDEDKGKGASKIGMIHILQGFSTCEERAYMLTEDVSDNFALGISDHEYISNDDLTDLLNQFQNNEDMCVSPTCKKRKRLQVQVKHQTLFSQTIKLPLFCFHQLVKPLLSWAGQSKTSLFLVRRAWQQRQGVSVGSSNAKIELRGGLKNCFFLTFSKKN